MKLISYVYIFLNIIVSHNVSSTIISASVPTLIPAEDAFLYTGYYTGSTVINTLTANLYTTGDAPALSASLTYDIIFKCWNANSPSSVQEVKSSNSSTPTCYGYKGYSDDRTKAYYVSIVNVKNTGTNEALVYLGYTQGYLSQIVYRGPTITIPPSTTCSVNVQETPIIPMYRGSASREVNVTSSGRGSGQLSFKPSAYEGNNGKLLNDSGEMITYTVTGTTWDSITNEWKGDLSEHAVKINDIASTTSAGEYRGTMTVTISCN